MNFAALKMLAVDRPKPTSGSSDRCMKQTMRRKQ
jgi:hypothetical protein